MDYEDVCSSLLVDKTASRGKRNVFLRWKGIRIVIIKYANKNVGL